MQFKYPSQFFKENSTNNKIIDDSKTDILNTEVKTNAPYIATFTLSV
jgi:hypothetical protein